MPPRRCQASRPPGSLNRARAPVRAVWKRFDPFKREPPLARGLPEQTRLRAAAPRTRRASDARRASGRAPRARTRASVADGGRPHRVRVSEHDAHLRRALHHLRRRGASVVDFVRGRGDSVLPAAATRFRPRRRSSDEPRAGRPPRLSGSWATAAARLSAAASSGRAPPWATAAPRGFGAGPFPDGPRPPCLGRGPKTGRARVSLDAGHAAAPRPGRAGSAPVRFRTGRAAAASPASPDEDRGPVVRRVSPPRLRPRAATAGVPSDRPCARARRDPVPPAGVFLRSCFRTAKKTPRPAVNAATPAGFQPKSPPPRARDYGASPAPPVGEATFQRGYAPQRAPGDAEAPLLAGEESKA